MLLLSLFQLIIEISVLSVLLKNTLGNWSSPQYVRCPNSVVEEIPDETPCCIPHLWHSVVGTIIL